MYGQIHLVVKELVETNFGTEKWKEVLEKCKLNEEDDFIVFRVYPDSTTFCLVESASQVLELQVSDMLKATGYYFLTYCIKYGHEMITTATELFASDLLKAIELSVNEVLKAFGSFFLTYCMKHGYDKMLTTLGSDLVSFIENLDSLHSLLSFSYTDIVAPSFRGQLGRTTMALKTLFKDNCVYMCVENEDGSLLLHYYSVRKGLAPIVEGILEAVGRQFFGQVAKLSVNSETMEDTGTERKLYHTEFHVEVENLSAETSGSVSSLVSQRKSRQNVRPTFDEHTRDPGTVSVIRSEDFNAAFPYHILLDRFLIIRECGDNIQKLALVPVIPGMPFREVATILQPAISPSANNVFSFINSAFVVALHRAAGQKPFVLKGQMMWLPHCFHLLFIGSPRLSSLEDFKNMKLFLCDVPIYDATRELVLLNQQRIAEIDVARKLDEATIELKKVSKDVEEEKLKTEELLHQMMPHKIAKQLTAGKTVPAEKYESCTMLFGDIVTFTEIAQKCPADDIVNMLNDIYHRFDLHTDAHDVYKVETIGDAYMAVTGVPEVQEDHAERMADFAMDMITEASYVHSPATGKPLKIRVGMHSGAVVAGVIGKKRPRFDIYGDTVNTASRMESYSATGRIHLSVTTFSLLYPYGYKFRPRGEIVVKGKGLMKTYFLLGHINRSMPEPTDGFCELAIVTHPAPVERVARVRKTTATFAVQKLDFVTIDRSMSSRSASDSNFPVRVSDTGYAPGEVPTLHHMREVTPKKKPMTQDSLMPTIASDTDINTSALAPPTSADRMSVSNNPVDDASRIGPVHRILHGTCLQAEALDFTVVDAGTLHSTQGSATGLDGINCCTNAVGEMPNRTVCCPGDPGLALSSPVPIIRPRVKPPPDAETNCRQADGPHTGHRPQTKLDPPRASLWHSYINSASHMDVNSHATCITNASPTPVTNMKSGANVTQGMTKPQLHRSKRQSGAAAVWPEPPASLWQPVTNKGCVGDSQVYDTAQGRTCPVLMSSHTRVTRDKAPDREKKEIGDLPGTCFSHPRLSQVQSSSPCQSQQDRSGRVTDIPPGFYRSRACRINHTPSKGRRDHSAPALKIQPLSPSHHHCPLSSLSQQQLVLEDNVDRHSKHTTAQSRDSCPCSVQ